MGKTVGDPAEIIRSLREALAADQEENRSFRALQAENARLKMKIEILQTIVKPPKDLDDLPITKYLRLPTQSARTNLAFPKISDARWEAPSRFTETVMSTMRGD